MREKADSDLMRRQNRRLVVDALRQHGSMARVELGRVTGLSPASITSISGQLIGEGRIREKDVAAAFGLRQRRGRPMVQLEIDPAAARIVMVKLSIDGMELVLADYRGGILGREALPIKTHSAPAASFGVAVARDIAAFLERHRVRRARVARIAVAVQGLADSQAGTIVWSPAFAARNIEVCEPVRRELGVSCTIANDANLMAEALIGTDPQRFTGNAAVVFLGYGVGMGLVLNGAVYHGATGAAAEFGHMNHMPGGPLCRCGRRGCIEAFAADYGIARMAAGGSGTTPPPLTRIPEETMIALEARARSGEPRALAAFEKAGEALGYGIARLSALLSPEHVALAGPGTRAMPLIEASLRRAFHQGLVDELARNVEIETMPLADDMIVRGAIDAALHNLDRSVAAAGLASQTRVFA